MRVLQVRRDADLTQKPLRPDDGRELRQEDLERDWPIVPKVPREEDRGHSAAPDLAFDRVAVREHGPQTLGERASIVRARLQEVSGRGRVEEAFGRSGSCDEQLLGFPSEVRVRPTGPLQQLGAPCRRKVERLLDDSLELAPALGGHSGRHASGSLFMVPARCATGDSAQTSVAHSTRLSS